MSDEIWVRVGKQLHCTERDSGAVATGTMLRSALLQITLVLVATDGITFFSIGDWGGAALGTDFVDNADAVASQMARPRRTRSSL